MTSEGQQAFAETVFDQHVPAHLSQGAWQHDQELLSWLHRSWQRQYSDYLGEDAAQSLVSQLLSSGALYDHDPRLTLQAWVSNQRVGIGSLRILKEQRELALITMLEVEENFHRQGIGRQLVRALESACDHLLAHVSIHRPQVKMFYQNLGFRCLQRSSVDHYGHALDFDILAK